jgi:hypothetical protein
VRFTNHVRTRLAARGTSEEEIADVVRTGEPADARPGYEGRAKVFPFESTWEGRHFSEKRVRVVYAVEEGNEVVVTVYVYYGRWSQ